MGLKKVVVAVVLLGCLAPMLFGGAPAGAAATADSGSSARSASSAATAPTTVFGHHTMTGQPVVCAPAHGGIRVCDGHERGSAASDLRLESFDGTPLAFYVTLPAQPARGGHGGPYPLVVQSHGWGAPPSGPNDAQYGGPTARQWAAKGYAVLQLAARGWGDSCGSVASRLVNVTACLHGYVHLDDFRYEARDVQYAVGLLVDGRIADPNRIGVTGESYGGGVSLDLATLENRVMAADGSLHPWKSPRGVPLHVAAAVPFAAYSDLMYSLRPNGRTRSSQVTPLAADLWPAGVEKASIVSGLFLVGGLGAYYAPPLLDSQADLLTWFATMAAGEPYSTPENRSMIRQAAQFHSSYFLLAGAFGAKRQAPAPLLLANGFTDDVFPADEVLRYYNLARASFPTNPIEVFLADIGHQRANNKARDTGLLHRRVEAFFDHYLKGAASGSAVGVTALTQTCPVSSPSGGPYRAATWDALHPGEVAYTSRAAQTVLSTGGNPLVAKAFDPILGGLACTTAPAGGAFPGVASYSLPAATGSGYTLLGAPQVTADYRVIGAFPYLAARLVDVDPATNTETLVARGIYRMNPRRPDGRQTFELHAGAWHFAAGHVPKLELLGTDLPFSRPSNGVFSVTVSNLQLRLPVHEVPGARGVPKVVTRPATTRLAPRPHDPRG